MSEAGSINIEPCPKCGNMGDYVSMVDGVLKVVACKCGYTAPGMAVAGVEVPLELPKYRLKSQVERDAPKTENEKLRADVERLTERVAELESLRAELKAANINIVAYGEKITELQKLSNYFEENYNDLMRSTSEINDAIIRYHDALVSIAESHPAIVEGKEWRMERQDAIQRAKNALYPPKEG